MNSMNWIVSVGEGDINVCVSFKAQIMHNMSSLNLAWNWQVVSKHVHSCGVCKFVVRFTWSCMHIIDVSDDSTCWY